MKRVALDDDKKLYAVLEEAIEQYLERRKAKDEAWDDNPTARTDATTTN